MVIPSSEHSKYTENKDFQRFLFGEGLNQRMSTLFGPTITTIEPRKA